MIAAIAVLSAAFGGWMLSGSPVPMALSLAAISLGPVLSKFSSPEKKLFIGTLLAVILFLIELHLFQTRQALALRADIPITFHFAMLFLWWFALEPAGRRICTLSGIVGSLLLIAAAAGTVLYDFGPWQTYPVLALPISILLTQLLAPGIRHALATIATMSGTALLMSGLLIGSIQLTDALQDTFSGRESEEDSFEERPVFSKTSATGLDGAARQIPREGNVVFNGNIKLYLKAKSPKLFQRWVEEPLYLRTAVLTQFESDEVISPLRSGRWIYDSDDGVADSRTWIGESKQTKKENYTVFLSRDGAQSLPLLPRTEALLTPAVYEFSDAWFQLSPPEEIDFLRFTATYQPDKANKNITPLPAELAGPTHLNLPPSPLARKVRNLTRSFDERKPLSEVKRYLANNVSYTLQFSTPERMSSIENVLFHDQEGHCEHFASATLIMLRSLGISSRLAYGYAGGAADRSRQLIAFRDSDFHTWTEILTKDGWVIFDTIPQTEGATNRNPAMAKVPALNAEAYHNFSAMEGIDESGPSFFTLLDLVSFLSDHFLVFAAATAGILAFFYFRSLRGKKQPSELTGEVLLSGNTQNSCPDFLEQIEIAGKEAGVLKNEGQTWREFMEQLGCKMKIPKSFREALHYYYRTEYAGKIGTPEEDEEFLSRIRNEREK